MVLVDVGVGGLAWRLVVLLSAAGGAYWPLTTYPCPSLEPSPSVGGGARRPVTTSCLVWPILSSPLTLPFPWGWACAQRAHGAHITRGELGIFATIDNILASMDH